MGLAAIGVLAISVEEVSTRVYRRRAECLLQDLRQLQVGKSTFEDARAVIVGHGGGVSRYDHSGSSPAHCRFEAALKRHSLFMDVWGPSLSPERLLQVVRVLPRFGVQDRWAGAGVRVDGGFVTRVSYAIFVRGSGGWVLGHDASEGEAAAKSFQDLMGQRPYRVHWFNITTEGGGEGIESSLTPQANAEQGERAYDFDFGCLTRLGGCTSLCQLAPAAFADYVKEAGSMPWLDEHDPNCVKFKPPERNPNNAAHP
jgi:hypothetical protein